MRKSYGVLALGNPRDRETDRVGSSCEPKVSDESKGQSNGQVMFSASIIRLGMSFYNLRGKEGG